MIQLYSRTSVTIDEAIGNLLALIDGPVEYQCLDNGASAVEMLELGALTYDLNQTLQDDYDDCVSAIAEAKLCDKSKTNLANLSANLANLSAKLANLPAKLATAKLYISLANRCRAAISDELQRQPSALLVDQFLSTPNTTYITLESLLIWADKNQTIIQAKTRLPKGEDAPLPQSTVDLNKPWWQVVQGDPTAKQGWYTPARYFARQLIAGEPKLQNKRDILAQKVAKMLAEVGINKRGGIKPFDPATILKAFTNIAF